MRTPVLYGLLRVIDRAAGVWGIGLEPETIIDIRTRDQRFLVEEAPHVSAEVLLLLIPVPSEIDNRMSKNQYGGL